jgi:long-chain acyl-CoA synthetase
MPMGKDVFGRNVSKTAAKYVKKACMAEQKDGKDTLPGLLLKNADTYGGRVALRRKEMGIWHDISWTAYRENAKKAALGLLAMGAERGECVAIISENRPEWLYIDLGVQSIGCVTAAVYATSAPDQVAYIVRHSGARFFFVEDEEQLDKALESLEQMPALEKIIVIDWKGLRDFSHPKVMSYEEFIELGSGNSGPGSERFEEEVGRCSPDDTALLVYTSGTTGPPKGAMLTHRNLIWTARALHRANPMNDRDEVLSFLPLCHIAERMMTVVLQLCFGYTVSFAENLDTVPQNLREVSPTIFFAVPRIWEKFHSKVILTMDDATLFKRLCFRAACRLSRGPLQRRLEGKRASAAGRLLDLLALHSVFMPLRKRLGLERARVAISGAAPISRNILEFFHMLGIRLREVYGQTEGCGPTTIHAGDSIRLGTVGQAVPGVEVRIAEDGEIIFRGPNVFKGYFKNPEATRAVIEDGWLHSGDVGIIDENGFLRITDRKKDLIITAGGKNIAPQNIENQLKASPYINDAVVIGDRRKFLTSLILIEEENVMKFAQDNGISFTTYADLARNGDIRKLIEDEIRAVNRSLADVEKIKKFRILERRLEQEEGELTPTMKIKRDKISRLYRDLIDEMYGPP